MLIAICTTARGGELVVESIDLSVYEFIELDSVSKGYVISPRNDA